MKGIYLGSDPSPASTTASLALLLFLGPWEVTV